MFEMMTSNVRGIIGEDRVKELIFKVKKTSQEAFEIIAITSYLTNFRSVLSLDVLISYFETTDYQEICKKIEITNSFLRDANLDLIIDEIDQDFYSLRSNLFSYYVDKTLRSTYRIEYGDVINKIIFNVSPYRIYKHYIFKRKAYDSEFFFEIFVANAHEIYERIYDYDKSAYTLQQRALYKSKLKDFPGAFSDIDKALSEKAGNFSIGNSRAIILFEANKDNKSDIAIAGMREAMVILSECYKSDKRKIYHAQKYAQFALHFAKYMNDKQYIDEAILWLGEITANEASISKWTRYLFNELKIYK